MSVAKDKPKKAPKVYKERASVTAKLKIGAIFYEATGSTVLEAIEGLCVRNPKGRGILTVSSGDRQISKVLGQMALVRLFSPSRAMRQLQLKNLYFMFAL